MTKLLEHLRQASTGGRKLLVPYLVGGIPDQASFGAALKAVARHADAVEVGLPYSDPLMDGPVIATAADRAIKSGVGPLDALEMAKHEVSAPRIAMTYYNPIHRIGEAAFCERVVAYGMAGLIVPDLPLEESESLRACAARTGLAWIPLVAPTSPPARVESIVETATGFVYAVSTLGVTGTRAELSERAAQVVERCKQHTDLPVLVGIGISTAQHAQEAAATADGVVIGSAVVTLVLGSGHAAAAAFLAEVRAALDMAPAQGK